MKLTMETSGGRQVIVERYNYNWVYITVVDLEGEEMHARLLLNGISGNEAKTLIGMLEVVADAEDDNGIG